MKELEEFFKNALLEEVTDKLKEYNVEFISTEKRDEGLYEYKDRLEDLRVELSYEGNEPMYAHLKGYKSFGSIIRIDDMTDIIGRKSIVVKVDVNGSRLVDTYRVVDIKTKEVVFEETEDTPVFIDFIKGHNDIILMNY